MRYAATIGFFDGVHRGHTFLIQQLIRQAQQDGLGAMLITFDNHPRQTLEGKSPALLLTREEREQRLRANGVNQIIEFRFDVIKGMTAEDFLHILHTQCEVDELLMGYDHRFGCDHLTNLADYQAAGSRADVRVLNIGQSPDGDISSTKIRNALAQGNLQEANTMLGYPYFLSGEVVHGKHIGTQLGFPTANLAVAAEKLIPLPGVYAATCSTGSTCLVNIGTNPTVGDNNQLTIEVHIPDFQGDLYGQRLTVELIRYLRPDKRFGNEDQLKQQILLDLQQLNN
ncbi:MAG: riboflavin biosynthesis protein RibF [Paludibacteraceae bacterium]|nr:riboflavin biosynthesis protein RibF [Paludibacteraceae bacterium]